MHHMFQGQRVPISIAQVRINHWVIFSFPCLSCPPPPRALTLFLSFPSLLPFTHIHLCMRACSLSATPWTVAHQSPLSVEFSRQEHWNGLLFPPSGDPPDPRVECASRSSLALADGVFITEPAGKLIHTLIYNFKHLQTQKLNLV